MNSNLKKIQKIIIGSMILLVMIILLIILLALFNSDTIILSGNLIAIGVIVPVLLVIVIGVAFFAKKFEQAQRSFVTDHINIVKNVLGETVNYVPKAQIPYAVIGVDPSLNAKLANSSSCNHMLTGSYKGMEYHAFNVTTVRSHGYNAGTEDTAHSVFDGYYILTNVNIQSVKPIYVCNKDFWLDFHVKESLHFLVNGINIFETKYDNVYQTYKLLIPRETPSSKYLNRDVIEVLNRAFHNHTYPFSLFVNTNGKLGMAIRKYKVFEFSKFKLVNIDEKEINPQKIKDTIYKDTMEIKSFLETLSSVVNVLK